MNVAIEFFYIAAKSFIALVIRPTNPLPSPSAKWPRKTLHPLRIIIAGNKQTARKTPSIEKSKTKSKKNK